MIAFEQPSLAGKEVTHERMQELAPVLLMDGKQFDRSLTGEGQNVTQGPLADLEGRSLGLPTGCGDDLP